MTQSFAAAVLLQWIEMKFGTVVIPFEVVAKEFFGWKTKKTALAKLNAGVVEKEGLKVTTTSGTKTFVLAMDLVEFLLDTKHVTISE